jgi:Lsr2
MAKVVSTAYVDDLDGSEASGPVDFSLDGKDYTIDLSDSNAARLRDALASFVTSARRASGSGRRQSSSLQRSASGRSREETQEIRSVLRELGYEVKDRGRVSSDLLAAYETRTPAPGSPATSSPRRSVRVERPAMALRRRGTS